MTRFEPYGNYPTTHRVFVCAEPAPPRAKSPVKARPVVLPNPYREPDRIEDSAMRVVAPKTVEPATALMIAATEPEARILAYLSSRPGWHRVIDVVRALQLTPRPVAAVLDRAWRDGLIERQVLRAFQPIELREFKVRTST